MKNNDLSSDGEDSPSRVKVLKTPVTSPFSKSIVNLLTPIQQMPSPTFQTCYFSPLNPCEPLNHLSPVLKERAEGQRVIQKLDFSTLKPSSTFSLNSITAKFTVSNEKEEVPVFAKQKRPRKETDSKICCNCSKSKCLKLYCECFAAGVLCEDCNCRDCLNTKNSDLARRDAVASTLDRNPTAFKPKIKVVTGKNLKVHSKGCNCSKSGCLKKYCECFSSGIACSGICHCIGCKNLDRK